jgi:hypothetical protein
MLMNALPLIASTTTKSYSSPAITSIRAQNSDDESMSILESLKKDIASNPNDFMTFETQSAAYRFIAEHGDEAYRETTPRVIRRGIVGYWQGKILVVLPSLSNAKPL